MSVLASVELYRERGGVQDLRSIPVLECAALVRSFSLIKATQSPWALKEASDSDQRLGIEKGHVFHACCTPDQVRGDHVSRQALAGDTPDPFYPYLLPTWVQRLPQARCKCTVLPAASPISSHPIIILTTSSDAPASPVLQGSWHLSLRAACGPHPRARRASHNRLRW